MVAKRSMAFMACVGLALAVGCSGAKSNRDHAAVTNVTDPYGQAATTSSVSPYQTTTTFAGDPDPIVRAPDPAAFCASIVAAQNLFDSFAPIGFDDGLARLAAPKQARDVARRLRQTAPDEVNDPANAYADIVDHSGQIVAGATSLRELQNAAATLQGALQVPAVQPLVGWYEANCQGASAANGAPT